MTMHRCYMDGFPFETTPILLPLTYDSCTGTFTFDNIVFCSFSCAKGYLFRDMTKHADLIILLTMYARTSFNITDPIRICPDRRLIREYLYQDVPMCMNITDFRAATPTYIITNQCKSNHTVPCIENTIDHLKVYVTDIVLPSTIMNVELMDTEASL